ncbi:hypothetical protein ES332_D02G223700v1 [Gossypium tomentosum]|uniref:Uncharacterized protein n=1 Tax=Gossypium tomentosum TaxID=34277 RepID=A0A5D2M0T7_GOSTO|nr:hypothetical protein ES332_D02G223700v1 [Gossypium tomentosum]
MLSLFVFSLYFDHLPTDRLQMGEVVSTIASLLRTSKMLMLRQLALLNRLLFSLLLF